MSVLVTCGPAYVPIDSVRRITNHSTGELGTLLSEALAAKGLDVLCLRGDMATYPPPKGVRVEPFSTNASLLAILEKIPAPTAIFHAAALCDFDVVEIPGKIRSDLPELTITLRPTEKILPRLRTLFPEAFIVGWKYEVSGDVLPRARTQIATAHTDACVANGPAYGDGFGFLTGSGGVEHFADKAALCAHLATLLPRDHPPQV